MIDASCPGASLFLWIAPPLFLILYALPASLAPFAWARLFRWRAEPSDDLALYFGRCTGALAAAICVACMRAAPRAHANTVVFELIALAGAALVVVHVVGALQRRQPWTETVEIALYAALTAVAIALRP
jgi:hypothetical protein